MSAPLDTKKARPDNLLFRSHIEMCRLLQVLVQEHCPFQIFLDENRVFKGFLLSIDITHQTFTTTFSVNAEANTQVLKIERVEITATDSQGLHYSFLATSPQELLVNDQPAIQFKLPEWLLLHNRRMHPRISVAADLSLRCIADEGGCIPFESRIVDVSHDGLGCLIYENDITLEQGAVLKGCRIVLPNGGTVTCDMELRYITPLVTPDGQKMHRAGFRFVDSLADISGLLGIYISNLDK